MIVPRLIPPAAAGRPAAVLLLALTLPSAVYLAQGLFYVPPRQPGRPVFIRPRDPALRLRFLPLPVRAAVEGGPALEAVCAAGDRGKLLSLALARLRPPLTARLALMLQARTPLDRLLKGLAGRAWPLVSPLARLINLLTEPARQIMRCWGYLFFRLWKSGDDPGPPDDLTVYKQALAYDLNFRSREGAGPDELRRVRDDLARIYANPDYGRELGRTPPDGCALDSGGISDEGENQDRPWLDPGYRGLYLDLPVTLAAANFDELYDQGPEEEPSNFYPPELGLEVELAARLRAERRRLAEALSAGKNDGLIWLDERLLTAWELENQIWELDDRLWREERRLAAHHRRCRSSHLAAARRKGGGWPELLTACLGRLFQAERGRPDWRDEALTALLAAEKAVIRKTAEIPVLPWLASETGPGPAAGPGQKSSAPPEPPPRVYSDADRLSLGFGRSLLALVILGLILWQGGLARRNHLTIHNGLAREIVVVLDGRRLPLAPFGRLNLTLPPGHECRIKTITADGQLVESFQRRISPEPGREVYNVAGAAPLMEWRSAAGSEAPPARFLGRPRWLATEAEALFHDPAPSEAAGGVLTLSGYGGDPPGMILPAFEDENDRGELIRLHARWDRPNSPWFWHWQVLLTGQQTGWMPALVERIKAEPEFLEEALARFE